MVKVLELKIEESRIELVDARYGLSGLPNSTLTLDVNGISSGTTAEG
jgi:hypothetical protein